MKLIVHNDDLTINTYSLEKNNFYNKELENHLGYISSDKKALNALKIIEAYYSNSKVILFDHTNKVIENKLKALNIPEYKTSFNEKTIFDKKDFSMIFFTSGSTGEPVGALKTKEHLENEIKISSKLLEKYKIKRVIVTVPFIHIYGTLMGIIYPLYNNIDIVLKQHFLPNDLLNLIEENSLIITTPLYIKALNKISSQKDLRTSVFISSTGPLDAQNAKEFSQKFNTNVIQIFGSTETGGIAYKYNDEELWTPFESVEISTNKDNELKIQSSFVSKTIFEKEFKDINSQLQTFDYIELIDNKFKLIGRSSQILKIAGKRYSTIQIEQLLEEHKDISKALVFVCNKDSSLKDESLDITIESKKEFSTKEIKEYLKHNLSNLKFSIKLKVVDKIPTSSVGKKLKII